MKDFDQIKRFLRYYNTREKTHQSLRPTHALSEEQQSIVVIDEALELCTIGCLLDIATMFAFPVREICRSAECIVQPRRCNIVFAGEERLEISTEIVHLRRKNLLAHLVYIHWNKLIMTYPID